MEQSIAAFRGELAGSARPSPSAAAPRHRIAGRRDPLARSAHHETRSSGSTIRCWPHRTRAVDIYSELRTLKPAEQLAGFDDAIRNLGGKLDQIVRTSPDPGNLRQLEDALAALKRSSPSRLQRRAEPVAEHVQGPVPKVYQLAASHGNSDMLSALEQRIAVLTTALEQRERPAMPDTIYFDNAVRAISDRLDHLQVGGDGASSLGHLEQRIHHLIERLEIATPQGGANDGLARVEQGLSEILRHLEQQRINAAAIDHGLRTSSQMDGALADTIKRELSDQRFSQSESVRHTPARWRRCTTRSARGRPPGPRSSANLREVRSAPPARDIARAGAPLAGAATRRNLDAAAAPELPNPAAAPAPLPRAALGRAGPPRRRCRESRSRPDRPSPRASGAPAAGRVAQPDRSVIAARPSDRAGHPGAAGTGASPAERIAASEAC